MKGFKISNQISFSFRNEIDKIVVKTNKKKKLKKRVRTFVFQLKKQ
jgi:hypothetical protein